MHARFRSPMLAIRDIDHLVLRVRDIEAMEGFYCRVLGTTVERRRPDLGLLHLRAGSSQIDLVSIDGPLGRQGGAAPGAEGRNLDHFGIEGPQSVISGPYPVGVDAAEGTREPT